MMALMAVPPAEFTPYLLQQSGLRASLLKSNFGFIADHRDAGQRIRAVAKQSLHP